MTENPLLEKVAEIKRRAIRWVMLWITNNEVLELCEAVERLTRINDGLSAVKVQNEININELKSQLEKFTDAEKRDELSESERAFVYDKCRSLGITNEVITRDRLSLIQGLFLVCENRNDWQKKCLDAEAKLEKCKDIVKWYADWDWTDKYVQAVPKKARELMKELGWV